MKPEVQKLQQIEQQLNAHFIERQHEIHAILLGICAQKNVLLIGAPGVAKSNIVDQFMYVLPTTYGTFKRLISPTTQPEELFGSVRFDRLKEGIMERNIEGQLPTAHVAFLDEVFKATSDLLNSLLKIMNEHRFENGTEELTTPLFTLIGASNEFPEEDRLNALYDRFLIRREVEAIQTPAHFMQMLQGNTEEITLPRLTAEEIQVIHAETKAVHIPQTIIEMLTEIHFKMKDAGIVVSDRRTKQCLSILQAEAYLQGRNEVKQSDFRVLVDCLWIESEDRETVQDLLAPYTKTVIDQLFVQLNRLRMEVDAKHAVLKQAETIQYEEYAQFASAVLMKWQQIEQEMMTESPTEEELQKLNEWKVQLHEKIAEEVM